MARSHHLACVAFLFLFAFVKIGEGLECFHCVGLHGSECDVNPTSNPSFRKNCTDPEEVCYIRNTTLIGGGQVNRDCAPKNECGGAQTKAADHNTTCTLCETKLCNTSSNLIPSFFIINILGIILASICM